MISVRSCQKQTVWAGSHNKYVCATHGVEMDSQVHTCSHGSLESYIFGVMFQMEHRLTVIENKITDRLAEFGRNLEKLHDEPPNPHT